MMNKEFKKDKIVKIVNEPFLKNIIKKSESNRKLESKFKETNDGNE